MNSTSHVIVALDFESAAQARQLGVRLGASAQFFKIGLQLLTAEGPSLVRELVIAGKQVFLDLKLHGGTDNGPPGLRPEYGPTYYAAFVIDPDGYRIEAVLNSEG